MPAAPGHPRPLLRALRAWAKRRHIDVHEALGTGRHAWPARDGLDRLLLAHLPPEPGLFVEAGANDGHTQSNTYHLETRRGWTGLLVEPVPHLARLCRWRRRRSLTVHAALVPLGYPAATIDIAPAGLMSVVPGAFGGGTAREQHLARAAALAQEPAARTIPVPARPLGDLLEAHLPGRTVDLLSLDVEGWELPALQGLAWPGQAPRWILVECRPGDGIPEFLAPWYDLVAESARHETYVDRLYRRRA